jgi:5S rRNA maturation endonuclease (ribonuclease M5)
MSDLSDHIETVARHYWGEPNAKLSNRTEIRFGTNGSKSVDLKKGCWYDHENENGGGVTDLIRQGEGLPKDAPVQGILTSKFGISPKPLSFGTSQSTIITQYDYHDASGQVVYQVTRSADKKFRQRRPDGKGSFIYNLKGVDPVPYNLPMIVQASEEPVFVVEGEKCADALIKAGFIATTNSGGAGKWSDDLSEYLRGRNVIVLPDNDLPGMRHADSVVASLWGKARQIKRVDLTSLPDKGDVVDFLETNSLEDLIKAVRVTPVLNDRPAVPDAKAAIESQDDYFLTQKPGELKRMPPVEWLVDGLLTQYGFSVMYGAPASGKSFIALDMALSVATGRPWQGQPVKQSAVCYIAAEGGGGFGKRIASWDAHNGVNSDDAPMFLINTAIKFREEDDVTKLLATIDKVAENEDVKFGLVIVDTVARALLGGDENSATDMGLFVEACDAIKAHTGGAVMGVHHAGKDATRGMRGSTALLGGVETSLMVSKSEEYVILRTEKQKDAEPMGDVVMKLTPIATLSDPSAVLIRTDEKPKSAQKKNNWRDDPQAYHAFQALQNLLIDQGGKRVQASSWHEAHKAKDPDLDRRQRQKARQKLVDSGVVVCDENIVWINRELA